MRNEAFSFILAVCRVQGPTQRKFSFTSKGHSFTCKQVTQRKEIPWTWSIFPPVPTNSPELARAGAHLQIQPLKNVIWVDFRTFVLGLVNSVLAI